MSETPVAHNCEQSPVAEAAVSHVVVQEKLGMLINRIAATTTTYWWKLLGDEPNSLCHLLDISADDMRLILRKCRVLYGPHDSFRTSSFEEMMSRVKLDYTQCRPHGKPEHFVKIGTLSKSTEAMSVPKEMYSVGGVLEKVPVTSVHLPGIRTKPTRSLTASILLASSNKEAIFPDGNVAKDKSNTDKPINKGSMTIYVDDLLATIRAELMQASRLGSRYSFSQTTERYLRKAAALAIKGALQDMINTWVERMGDDKEAACREAASGECLSTPAIIAGSSERTSERVNVVDSSLSRDLMGVFASSPFLPQRAAPTITPQQLDLTGDVEEDESDVDIVLSELKEETILQNLLHKRLLTKNQRVIMLEHKNGRKLRVIVPPDSQTDKSFVDDAKKTHWINDMLHSESHRRCLLYTSDAADE